MGRHTDTGEVLEKMVLPALRRGGYSYSRHTSVGKRPGGTTHYVDLVVSKKNQPILVSMKWQQVTGTAEQKIAYEAICILKALSNHGGHYIRGYIVLGGDGWTLRNFYTKGGLNSYITDPRMNEVKIVTFERFIALANRGEL